LREHPQLKSLEKDQELRVARPGTRKGRKLTDSEPGASFNSTDVPRPQKKSSLLEVEGKKVKKMVLLPEGVTPGSEEAKAVIQAAKDAEVEEARAAQEKKKLALKRAVALKEANSLPAPISLSEHFATLEKRERMNGGNANKGNATTPHSQSRRSSSSRKSSLSTSRESRGRRSSEVAPSSTGAVHRLLLVYASALRRKFPPQTLPTTGRCAVSLMQKLWLALNMLFLSFLRQNLFWYQRE